VSLLLLLDCGSVLPGRTQTIFRTRISASSGTYWREEWEQEGKKEEKKRKGNKEEETMKKPHSSESKKNIKKKYRKK